MILYHGTSSKYLSDILKNGLQPRIYTNNSNYDEDSNPSNEQLVYLTSHWHYFYAFMTTNFNKTRYSEAHNIDFEAEMTYDEMTEYEAYYRMTGDVPIIIEVEVPVEFLTFDEDIAYFNQFIRDVKDKKISNLEDIDYQYSLQQFTCTCMEAIPTSMIKSIEVAAYYDLDYILGKACDYGCFYTNWCNGITIKEKTLTQALEEAVEIMKDYNLGGFDSIDLSKKKTKIVYGDSCVNVL